MLRKKEVVLYACSLFFLKFISKRNYGKKSQFVPPVPLLN